MDKLMNTKWFMKVVSLLLAGLLYASVNFDEQAMTVRDSGAADSRTEIIEDVPVNVYYDTENLYVSGVPETIDVTVSGPANIVQSTRQLKDFEVFIDLSTAEIGAQRVEIQVRDISEKLSVTKSPAYADVDVQERVTEEFTVRAEFNRSMIEEGYRAGEPEISEPTVQVTGAKNVIDQIEFVVASVNSNSPVDETVQREATISVLDANLNKLDVLVEPEIVNVTIPVERIEKTVDISLVQAGSVQENVTINSVTSEVDEITLFGPQEVLDKIESVEVPLDISTIEGGTELTVPIELPEGVLGADPEEIVVVVDAEQDAERTLEDVEVSARGLQENEQILFVSPEEGATNLVIRGEQDVVNALEEEDIAVFIDVSQLDAGEHEVELQIEGIENVEWELAEPTAIITIEETESTES